MNIVTSMSSLATSCATKLRRRSSSLEYFAATRLTANSRVLSKSNTACHANFCRGRHARFFEFVSMLRQKAAVIDHAALPVIIAAHQRSSRASRQSSCVPSSSHPHGFCRARSSLMRPCMSNISTLIDTRLSTRIGSRERVGSRVGSYIVLTPDPTRLKTQGMGAPMSGQRCSAR